MPPLYALLAFLVAQRLGELWLASRNTRRLRAQGAIEVGARHYPLIVAVHVGWLVALALLIDPATPMRSEFLAAFVLLQAGRVWVIATLGPYWTTRVMTLPEAPLVRRGPYRFVRHPNYLVVVGEIAVVPLMFEAWGIAVAFSLLNGLVLWHRIRVEDAALRLRQRREA